MDSDKSRPPLPTRNVTPSFFLFFIKRKHFLIVCLTVTILLVFPLIIFEMISKTIGYLELNDLKKKVNKDTPGNILISVSNYYEKYSPQLSLLEVQLEALEKIDNPTWEDQIRKIRLIKIILKNTWFPDYQEYQRLANILYEMGYYQDSLNYFEKYVITDSDISESDKTKVQERLYQIYMATENYGKAIQVASVIIKNNPDNFEWSYKLAQSYLGNQQLTLARVELEKVVYATIGSSKQFLPFFELIDVLTQLNLNDKVEFYLRYMASIYTSLDKREEILSAYAQYLSNQKDHEQVLETWQTIYLVFNPKAKIKNIKNNFDKFLKS